jgi:hypothetical protein
MTDDLEKLKGDIAEVRRKLETLKESLATCC